jgi:hypothetical protein
VISREVTGGAIGGCCATDFPVIYRDSAGGAVISRLRRWLQRWLINQPLHLPPILVKLDDIRRFGLTPHTEALTLLIPQTDRFRIENLVTEGL